MIITKRYYVIFHEKNIVMHGCSIGMAVYANVDYAEFDTEAEMLQYITDNNLEVQNETA
jgi:hypothetical protein